MKRRPKNQGGFALFFVLIILVIASSLVALGLRSNAMQERMVAGTRDRMMALQSAEVALSEAQESIVASRFGEGGQGMDCSIQSEIGSELCFGHPSLSGPATADRGWVAADDLIHGGLSAGAPEFSLQYIGRRESQVQLGLGDEPNYGESPGLIEGEYYRVLARGSDPTEFPDRSIVFLQATVVRE